jgi:hypothetical protein
MRRAFIVRPFGLKKEYDVNFDEVETQLISPALGRAFSMPVR